MKTILITGAGGNIGAKLAQNLKTQYNLVLLDLQDGPGITVADISEFDDGWATHFKGVDVVVHLAGEGRPVASWAECYKGNVEGTRNVLRAARAAGVGRVIYASSNQINSGYRFQDKSAGSDSAPLPLNPYGISKLICEELGNSFAEETGISFIALRIGMLKSGENQAGPDNGIGIWGQQMWLSDRDGMDGLKAAIEAKDVPYAVLDLVSNNPENRWDMEKTEKTIGFKPKDSHAPGLSDESRKKDEIAKKAKLVPGYWLDQCFNKLG